MTITRITRTVAAGVTAFVLTVGLASFAPTAVAAENSPLATDVLNTLTVKGRGPMTGYTRNAFGPAWKDVNRNGCDTRNDILTRDLDERVMRGNCVVLSGVLYPEPYTGNTNVFTRGKSTIDIDHVVALGNAWVSGGSRLPAAKREALANDPLNLLAVDFSANRQKGDADAATWLPANKAYRCAYVARQIAVKAKYVLSVTPAERDAMTRVLAACPGERVVTDADAVFRTPMPTAGNPNPTASGSPVVPTTPTPTATPGAVSNSGATTNRAPVTAANTDTSAAGEVRYANCDAARAAGVAPILRDTNPTLYAANTHLDRDKDGRACT